jgi:two-component system, LytTR family, sensor kinase
MGAKRGYWIYQTAWWGIYSAIGLAINVANGGSLRLLIFTHVLFFAYSIGLTHLFRKTIEWRRSQRPSLVRMRLFLGAGVLVVSLIQTVLVITIDAALSRAQAGSWTRGAMAALWYGMYIGTLIWTAIYMRITERRLQAEREAHMQRAVHTAELRALEAQINPHFLFNSLNSIRGLVAEDPQKAQDMITRFAALLRYNLNRDRQHTVPLSQETEVVGDYLALESMRFEGRLRIQFTVDPATESMQVPPMILQALVENALKHGIAHRPEGGDVRIHAVFKNGVLVLEVQNTGELEAAHPSLDGCTQIGLNNIRERLRLLYGDRASISLQNGDGLVAATVRIPTTT